ESRYTQLVGTLYHQALQKIGTEGVAAWTDAGASRRASLAAGFRRLGLPEPQVETAVARVLSLLQLTLAGPNGRWLLAAKSWAQSEYQLAGYLDGHWISASIDRCFEEADGTLWVVDYKTAGRALEGAALEAYLQIATERYREQLTLYARLLQLQRPEKAVRAALYFADADRLAELPVTA
ncbi:MAG: PD-(D/E)XK nuclease family protein, partial [Burkholderiales bacterium]